MRIKAELFGGLAAVVALATVVLSGCAQVVPLSPEQKVQTFLTKAQGLHVVDIEQVGINSSNGYLPSRTLCMSAPYSIAYRAYQQDGKTVIGLACLEGDDTVVIQLQKVFG